MAPAELTNALSSQGTLLGAVQTYNLPLSTALPEPMQIARAQLAMEEKDRRRGTALVYVLWKSGTLPFGYTTHTI